MGHKKLPNLYSSQTEMLWPDHQRPPLITCQAELQWPGKDIRDCKTVVGSQKSKSTTSQNQGKLEEPSTYTSRKPSMPKCFRSISCFIEISDSDNCVFEKVKKFNLSEFLADAEMQKVYHWSMRWEYLDWMQLDFYFPLLWLSLIFVAWS